MRGDPQLGGASGGEVKSAREAERAMIRRDGHRPRNEGPSHQEPDLMTKSLLRAFFAAAGLFVSAQVCSSDLSGRWTLSVENPEHLVVATLKVEFTDKQAASCMAGEWKVVKVVSATTRDKDFFPSSDPLAYRVENNRLTIGRNELCDAYLWLQGPVGGPSVKGDYISLGLEGSSPLGYFSLARTR